MKRQGTKNIKKMVPDQKQPRRTHDSLLLKATNHEPRRLVTTSFLIKENLSMHTSNLSQNHKQIVIQDKLLNSLSYSCANLFSLHIEKSVLRTKLTEEEGYDKVIRSKFTQGKDKVNQVVEQKGGSMTCPKTRYKLGKFNTIKENPSDQNRSEKWTKHILVETQTILVEEY